jgi:thiol-disulfide isomerase/thioredoxin
MNGISRIALLSALALAALAGTVAPGATPTKPAELNHLQASDWINSAPLQLASLKGKVVVVEFWAFECDNCVKSRAWIDSMQADNKGDGLVWIGVHTPELRDERDPKHVREAVEKQAIHYPVMLDQDGSYWRAMHIQVWPTFCLIGRDGLNYACVPGEMDVGNERAEKVKSAIELLLKAPPA